MTRETLPHDLLNHLAGITADSETGRARAQREAATAAAQASYRALFEPVETQDLDLLTRLQVAEHIALLHEDTLLAEHYRTRQAGLAGAGNDQPRLQAALQHAELLSRAVVQATPQHLAALQAAGWQTREIITLAQIVGFISFQSRLLTGVRLIAGALPPGQAAAPVAGIWHQYERTATGRPAPRAFTREGLGWEPWLALASVEQLNEQEVAVLDGLGILQIDYYMLLAHDVPILEHRTLLDRGILFTPGGLPRAERELTATVTSKVNGCIVCAHVHSPLAVKYSRREDDVQRLLDIAPGTALSSGQEPRWAALIDFAGQLAATPAQTSQQTLVALREQGFDALQLLDVVQVVAFFSWANRLMLSLGEGYEVES